MRVSNLLKAGHNYWRRLKALQTALSLVDMGAEGLEMGILFGNSVLHGRVTI
jgi:hypothetical protein